MGILTERIDYNNVNVIAYIGFIIFLGLIAMTWGYKADEKVREDQRTGRANAPSYHLDGDGLTTPLTVEDPIAYRKIGNRKAFLLQTFINCTEREHVILGTLFYSETFSRPQRVVCILSFVTAVMGVKASIYGQPFYIAVRDQYVASGVLSALLAFPLYCLLYVMFTCRPTQLKKVQIKRKYRSNDLQRIENALFEAEKEANKAPPSLPPMIGSAHRPLVGGLPTLPPIPSEAAPRFMLPVGGLPALPPGPAPPSSAAPLAAPPPPQALLP